MLQFVFGRAATGKSTLLQNMISQCVEAGKQVVMLVPEQFSFETEKSILQLLGDRRAMSVSVMSFSRLCDEVEHQLGGICAEQLTDASKHILLSRSLRDCAEKLVSWKRYARFQGFVSALLDSIEEFKLNAVTPEDLRLAAEQCDSTALSAKLNDAATVLEYYNALINERFIDPSDRLTRLYDRLSECDFFKGKTVFIDSFKGFTGQQYKILSRILGSADEVTIALTNDCEDFKRFDIFENIRLTVSRIKNLAKKNNVKIKEDIVLKDFYFKNNSLCQVEELIYKGKTERDDKESAVNIFCGADMYDEAEYAARTIRRLVRTKGYRYRDFVIIVRNTTGYEQAVLSACERNGVSCFTDKRTPLTEMPTVSLVLAAFNAVNGFSTEHIMRFYKCGLSVFSTEQLSELENYTRLWNVGGRQWLNVWDMDPQGLVAENSNDSSDKLGEINSLREKAIAPINRFKNSFKGNAQKRSTAIIALLEECKAASSFIEICKELKKEGRLAQADALRQSWDMLIDIFDSLVNSFSDEEIEDEEYIFAFKTAASMASVGVAPQMLDEVSFGAADRIRPSRPKIAFVLGANQGVFPAVLSSNGIFGLNDREKMINCGIDIPDRSMSSAIDEDFLVYSNLCCATDGLYLSYSNTDTAGATVQPSAFVNLIRDALDIEVVNRQEFDKRYLPETAASAFSSGCSALQDDRDLANAYFSVLEEKSEFALRAKRVLDSTKKFTPKISSQTAKRLYGTSIRMSASKFDVFNRCKFQYFCRYGLGAKRLQPADFDVLQRGTLIHYAFERLFGEFGSLIKMLDDSAVCSAIDRYITEYLDSVKGYASIKNARMIFLVENISRSVKEVALQIRNEFAQSEFEPKYCEFSFGNDERPSVDFEFEGGKVMLGGSVDRVDTWNGYVRNFDYKSGSRSFILPDILVGQNMQMLLYLYSVFKMNEFEGFEPAGIFYMPSTRDKNQSGLAMNGLMPADEELVKAMEKENKGVYVPKYAVTASGELNKNYAASFIQKNDFKLIFEHIERLLKRTGRELLEGNISIDPVDGLDSAACKYSDFANVCEIGDTVCPKVEKKTNQEVVEELEKEGDTDGI